MAWDIAALLVQAAPWLLIVGGAAHVAQKQFGILDNKIVMGITWRTVVGVASAAAGVFILMA